LPMHLSFRLSLDVTKKKKGGHKGRNICQNIMIGGEEKVRVGRLEKEKRGGA